MLVSLLGLLIVNSGRKRGNRQTGGRTDTQTKYCNPRCACAPRVSKPATDHSNLDGPIAGPGGKPLIARLNGDAADPAEVATDDPHQLPGRVPLWPHRLESPAGDQLLRPLAQHQRLEVEH